jgi:hypothetical protein
MVADADGSLCERPHVRYRGKPLFRQYAMDLRGTRGNRLRSFNLALPSGKPRIFRGPQETRRCRQASTMERSSFAELCGSCARLHPMQLPVQALHGEPRW